MPCVLWCLRDYCSGLEGGRKEIKGVVGKKGTKETDPLFWDEKAKFSLCNPEQLFDEEVGRGQQWRKCIQVSVWAVRSLLHPRLCSNWSQPNQPSTYPFSNQPTHPPNNQPNPTTKMMLAPSLITYFPTTKHPQSIPIPKLRILFQNSSIFTFRCPSVVRPSQLWHEHLCQYI